MPTSARIQLGEEERRARHRDEVGERVGTRDEALGEKTDRAGGLLALPRREERVHDVAELLAGAKSLRRGRGEHEAKPARDADASLAIDRGDPRDELDARAVVDHAALESDGEIGPG